jgi:RND family efflux transporter MFP subunit
MVAVVVTARPFIASRARRRTVTGSTSALGAGALVGLALVLGGCGGKPQVAQLPPPEVAVAHPVERDVGDFFETTGRTVAVDAVEIRARVSGYLVKVNFKDGDEVEPGTVLFEIDPRPFQAQKQQAEGDLAQWQAQKKKAEADLARNQRLLPTGAASQKDFDSAVAAKGTADAAQIISAQGRLDQADLNLEFSKVTAPVRGRLSKANVTIGNLVEASTVLTTLVSLEPMYMYFDIDERTVLQYRKNYRDAHPDVKLPEARDLAVPVDIGLANETGYPNRGTLDFVDNQVNPATGTMQARAVFTNDDRHLSPGLFVRVRLPVGDPKHSLLVNERAIGTDQGNKYVLVVNGQNVVEYKVVQLGPLDEGMRVVRGIAAGDQVIVDGLQRARPGITVNPHPVAATGDAAANAAPAQAPVKAPAATGH